MALATLLAALSPLKVWIPLITSCKTNSCVFTTAALLLEAEPRLSKGLSNLIIKLESKPSFCLKVS